MKKVLIILLVLLTSVDWVQAKCLVELPPTPYDFPHTKTLVIKSDHDYASLFKTCSPFGGYACAFRNPDGCTIHMLKSELMYQSLNGAEKQFQISCLQKHEIGHCNGWPANHPRN